MMRTWLIAAFAAAGLLHGARAHTAEYESAFFSERPNNVPTVHVPIDVETTLYPHTLQMVDAGSGYVIFDDGSKWQGDTSDGEVIAELERWQRGDWIGIHPPRVNAHGSFQLENRSRGNGELVKVSLQMPPMDDPWLSKPVDWLELRGMFGTDILHLQDGSSWQVEHKYRKILEQWTGGEPTVCDLVEDYRYCLGSLVIRQRALIINVAKLTYVLADPSDVMSSPPPVPAP